MTANEALVAVYDDHNWKPANIDVNTTPGIQAMLKAHTAAIQALADHIDGVTKDEPVKDEPKPFVSPAPTPTPQPSAI